MIWKKLKNRIEPRHIAVTSAAMVLSVVMAAMMLVPPKGTSAYVEMSTGVFDNIMNIRKVPNEIIETFTDNKVKTDVKIKNDASSSKAYVRAAVTANWVKTDSEGNSTGEFYAEKPVEGTDYTVTWNNDGWVLGKDGYYYYPTMLNAQDVTGVLLTQCQRVTTPPDGYKLSVEIMAETIQAEGDDIAVEAPNGYENLPVILSWGSDKGGSVRSVDTDDKNKALIVDTVEPYVYYRAHMTDKGDIGSQSNGKVLGNTESIYHWLEGIQIQAVQDGEPIGDVEYQVLTIKEKNKTDETEWKPSDDSWKSYGGFAGTNAESRPLLGVKIQLKSESQLAEKYSVKYSVLLKTVKSSDFFSYGSQAWTDEVADGELAGVDNSNPDSNGYIKIIGAIKVWLEPNNTTTP
ncbi:MAG: hypothetical protein ACI4RP_09630 [Acutalibacteraceae bacterium]